MIEQGTFESLEYKSISESDLKGSLDSEQANDINDVKEKDGIENRLLKDYQLSRAIDFIHGINIYNKNISEN